jgi:hypothetical protein
LILDTGCWILDVWEMGFVISHPERNLSRCNRESKDSVKDVGFV